MMNSNSKTIVCSKILILTFLICLVSCSGRPKLLARSQIIEEAKDKGLPVKTIEEENAQFIAHQKSQESKLVGLLKARQTGSAVSENYRIGTGDELEIYVFDVPDLNTTVRVRDSGFIALPLIGAVEASNKTENELVEELSQRLKTFVRSPQVSVFITSYSSQKVAVIGAVNKPGTFAIKKGQNSMSEFISKSGGLNDKAGNYINFVPSEQFDNQATDELTDPTMRASLHLASAKTPNTNQVVEVEVARLLGTDGGVPLDIPLKGGDMIIIPEAGGITVEGEVVKAGAQELLKGMTLISGLAAVGGITYSANVSEVELIRKVNADKTLRLIVDLAKIASGEQNDVLLRNGDIIRVPSHSGRRVGQDTFDSITKLINFGVGGTVPLR